MKKIFFIFFIFINIKSVDNNNKNNQCLELLNKLDNNYLLKIQILKSTILEEFCEDNKNNENINYDLFKTKTKNPEYLNYFLKSIINKLNKKENELHLKFLQEYNLKSKHDKKLNYAIFYRM